MSEPIETQAVVVHQGQPVATVPAQQPNIGQMIQAVLQGGITSETASVVERLAPLLAQERDHNAKMAFNSDFCLLAGEMHKVKATKTIPGKDGRVRSTFAPFEEVDKQLRPIALKYGFTYTFSEGAFQQGKVTKICTVMHKGGHERSNPYSVRIGQGPPGCSESQADGSAHSYAKRGAICDAFCIIVTGMDNDARLEGAMITSEQVADLKARVKATSSDEKAFLKFAQAPTYETITSTKWAILDEFLAKKARLAKPQYITLDQATDLKARLAAVGGDAADFLAGAASFEAIPASRYAVMDGALKKMEGK